MSTSLFAFLVNSIVSAVLELAVLVGCMLSHLLAFGPRDQSPDSDFNGAQVVTMYLIRYGIVVCT